MVMANLRCKMPVLQLVLGNIFFDFAFLTIHAFTRKVIVSSKLINKIMKNGKKND